MITAEMEEYQTLTRGQKVKKVLPKVLPVLLLSVILPTADVGTDLVLITRLYTPACVDRDQDEYRKCENAASGKLNVVKVDQYCKKRNPDKVSNNTICGVSQYYCREYRDQDTNEYRQCKEVGPDQYCTPEMWKCKFEVGPDKYCTEIVSNTSNTVCRRKNSFWSDYFCRYYKIWSNDWKDYDKCSAQGPDKYCSDPARNKNVCLFSPYPMTARSLLFFFLLNYVMGLVNCIRLEGRKWVPLICAVFNVYPQYCK